MVARRAAVALDAGQNGYPGACRIGLSATFAGLNYFKVPKARAVISLDHFEDRPSMHPFPGVSEKLFHSLRMWIVNNGQASAKIHNVAIDPEPRPELLTPDEESQRMA